MAPTGLGSRDNRGERKGGKRGLDMARAFRDGRAQAEEKGSSRIPFLMLSGSTRDCKPAAFKNLWKWVGKRTIVLREFGQRAERYADGFGKVGTCSVRSNRGVIWVISLGSPP